MAGRRFALGLVVAGVSLVSGLPGVEAATRPSVPRWLSALRADGRESVGVFEELARKGGVDLAGVTAGDRAGVEQALLALASDPSADTWAAGTALHYLGYVASPASCDLLRAAADVASEPTRSHALEGLVSHYRATRRRMTGEDAGIFERALENGGVTAITAALGFRDLADPAGVAPLCRRVERELASPVRDKLAGPFRPAIEALGRIYGGRATSPADRVVIAHTLVDALEVTGAGPTGIRSDYAATAGALADVAEAERRRPTSGSAWMGVVSELGRAGRHLLDQARPYLSREDYPYGTSNRFGALARLAALRDANDPLRVEVTEAFGKAQGKATKGTLLRSLLDDAVVALDAPAVWNPFHGLPRAGGPVPGPVRGVNGSVNDLGQGP